MLTDVELTPLGFADLYLGLSDLADWQARAIQSLADARVGKKRASVTIVAPNGSGKDARIIPAISYWWRNVFKNSRVVITSASQTQIEHQTQASLDLYYTRFGWPTPTKSPRWTLRGDEGDSGFIVAYVTDDAGRVEGWHERPDSPLLLIVNEAKTVTDDIFRGLDRCTPTAIVYISSPGLMEGRFFETHSTLNNWTRIKAGLLDCPWIPPEKILNTIATYGEDDPMTRSILHGEFMKQADDKFYCITHDEWDKCLESPPNHKPGFNYGFWDFADGRAENVLVRRNGNKFWIEDAFREKDEDAVVGRAIYLMHKSGLKPEQFGGDAAAKGILDKLASAGWPINRQSFGQTLPGTLFKSWSVKAWVETCNQIKRREIIIPNDKKLRSQACSREKKYTQEGKLALRDKAAMQKEGIESPDRMDALIGAATAFDTSLLLHEKPFDFTSGHDRNEDYEVLGVSVGY